MYSKVSGQNTPFFFLETLTSQYDCGPVKLPGLSRNRASFQGCSFHSALHRIWGLGTIEHTREVPEETAVDVIYEQETLRFALVP